MVVYIFGITGTIADEVIKMAKEAEITPDDLYDALLFARDKAFAIDGLKEIIELQKHIKTALQGSVNR